MDKVHVSLNHFPIALLLASLLFDYLYLVTKEESWKKAAYYNLLLGIFFGGLSLASGLLIEKKVTDVAEIDRYIKQHKVLTLSSFSLWSFLAFWRGSLRDQLAQEARAIYLFAASVAALVLLLAAYYGGEMGHPETLVPLKELFRK